MVRMVKWSKILRLLLDSWNVILQAKLIPVSDHLACPPHSWYFRKQEIPVPERESKLLQVLGLKCRYRKAQPSSLPFISRPQLETEFRWGWAMQERGSQDPHMDSPLSSGPLETSGCLGPLGNHRKDKSLLTGRLWEGRNHSRFQDY